MKKRWMALLLIACLALSLCACKGKDVNEPETQSDPAAAVAADESTAADTSETPSETAAPTTTETTTAPTTTAKPTTTAAPTTTTTKPTTTAAPTTTAKPTTTKAPTTTAKPTTTKPTTTKPTTTKAPTTKPTTTQAEKTVDLTALRDRIISSAGVQGAMPLPKERLTDLYGIAQGDIASAGCFITVNGSFPDEAIMIEAKNSAAKSRIVSALNTRLSDVLVQAQNYDPEDYALARQCKVITSGNYVALFVSPSHAAMESTFRSAVG